MSWVVNPSRLLHFKKYLLLSKYSFILFHKSVTVSSKFIKPPKNILKKYVSCFFPLMKTSSIKFKPNFESSLEFEFQSPCTHLDISFRCHKKLLLNKFQPNRTLLFALLNPHSFNHLQFSLNSICIWKLSNFIKLFMKKYRAIVKRHYFLTFNPLSFLYMCSLCGRVDVHIIFAKNRWF